MDTRERLGRWLTYAIATAPHWILAWTMYPAGFGKVPLLLPAIWILTVLALIGMKRGAPSAKRYGPLLIALGVYLAAYAVTSALGVDWRQSVWGTESRQNGLVILLHLALFACLLPEFLRTPAHWRMFERWLFWPAVAVSLMVLLEALSPGVRAIYGETGRYSAWIGNPSFYGGYVVLAACVGFRLFHAVSRTERVAVALGVLTIALGVLMSGSRGALGALVVAAIVFLAAGGLPLPRANRLRWAGIGVVLIALAAGVLFFAMRSGSTGLTRFDDFFTSDTAPRLISARIAWEGFRERPITGWGPENFQTVFDRKYDPELLRYSFYETVSDKPHSLPFEVLVTGGVLLTAAWVALWVTLAVALVRAAQRGAISRPAMAASLAMLAAYLTHSAALFDILPTSLLVFSLVGYALAHAAPESGQRRIPFAAGIVLMGTLLVADVFLLVPTVPASAAVVNAIGEPRVSPSSWSSARAVVAATKSPHRDELVRYLALDFILRDGRGDWPTQAFAVETPHIRALMEEVAQRRPDDHMAHFLLGQLLGLELEYSGAPEALAAAERELARAGELSPERQAVSMQLARVYVAAKKGDEAVRILEELVAKDPTQKVPQWFLGLAYAGVGKGEQAADALAAAIRLGRVYRTVREAQFAIDIFAAEKRYDDVIPIYLLLIERDPQNFQWHARLATTYAAAGKPELAALEAQRTAELNPEFADQARRFQEALTEPSAP